MWNNHVYRGNRTLHDVLCDRRMRVLSAWLGTLFGLAGLGFSIYGLLATHNPNDTDVYFLSFLGVITMGLVTLVCGVFALYTTWDACRSQHVNRPSKVEVEPTLYLN